MDIMSLLMKTMFNKENIEVETRGHTHTHTHTHTHPHPQLASVD